MVGPPYTRFLLSPLRICGGGSTVIFTIEKNPPISAPVQFESVLFKGQLYCRVVRGIKDHWPGVWGLKNRTSGGVIHRAREDAAVESWGGCGGERWMAGGETYGSSDLSRQRLRQPFS